MPQKPIHRQHVTQSVDEIQLALVNLFNGKAWGPFDVMMGVAWFLASVITQAVPKDASDAVVEELVEMMQGKLADAVKHQRLVGPPQKH
jgi:hypothetical protein